MKLMKLINIAKLNTALLAVAAVLVVGWIAHTDYKLQHAAEERVLTLERKVDSLASEHQRVVDLADQIAKGVDVLSGRAPAEIYLEYVDSVQALQIRQREAAATMRFIMSDSSVVLGTWADVQDRVWDIRRAEPLWKPDSTEIVK